MLSLSKDKIKVLLLENIHENARKCFENNGYFNVTALDYAPETDELKELIKDAHIVGIRSRTKLTKEVLDSAEKLFCAGCFCIGTNQVDLDYAKQKGVLVFNAPHSNTRSVAELVLGEVIMLLRGVPEKSMLAHAGKWKKSATGSKEARGKTLGIIGYGHIGSQLSILAEAIGMNVIYYDVVEKLALGNAVACNSLEELLKNADVVSLHVPGTPETTGMISEKQISAMKKGAMLINASRGQVVDIDALEKALKSGHIGGAACDVFPKEPASADEEFVSPLRGINNVLLTPHIGGSTEEAQENIAQEVAGKLVKYSDNGSSIGAVNFVQVVLPVADGVTRFLHIHRNVPGVMSKINDVFSSRSMNVSAQYLRTDGETGYVVVDVDEKLQSGMGIRKGLEAIEGTIKVRFLL